jgi:glycosyltransferase involved in cell wall biosynthesis
MTDETRPVPRGPDAARRVTVVVPTRDRPSHIGPCVASILSCERVLELIVVDQSEGNATADAVTPYLADPRVQFVRSATRGVAAARNVGLRLARGTLIACTDDDCRVPAEWVDRIEDVFADPDAAVVCGRVTAPDDAAAVGLVAQFEPRERVYQGRFPLPWQLGISANMIVRREVFERVGGFDEMLGAGSALRSGAEGDLLLRVLSAGLKVVNAREVVVLHLGVRPYGPAERALRHGYMFGSGALLAKHARLGGPARWVFVRCLGTLLRNNLRSVLKLARPTGIGLTITFLRGALRSLQYPIDRRSDLYVPKREGARPA